MADRVERLKIEILELTSAERQQLAYALEMVWNTHGDWAVKVVDDGGHKIQCIKVIREITGLGLKEAKDLADNLPAIVRTGLYRGHAEEFKQKFEREGVRVELNQAGA